MPAPSRITLPLSEEFIERLRFLSDKIDISQAKLVSCLLNMADEEIERTVAEHREKLFTSKAAQKEKIRQAKKLLDNLEPAEIERILSLAKAQENE